MMVCFTNKQYSVKIDNGSIVSLTNGKKEFIRETMPLFRMRMINESGNTTEFDSCGMKNLGYTNTDNRYIFRFDGEFVSAEVFVTFGDEISWSIDVVNHSEFTIEWIDFPQIAVPNDLKGNDGSSMILWGFNEGVIVDDITQRELTFKYVEPSYPSSGIMGIFPAIVETQFMAYFDEGENGLYFGAHDKNGNLKGIDFYRHNDGIKLQYRIYPGCEQGESFSMDYSIVMKFFEGGWYEAADIYKSWFEPNKSDEFIPIASNKDLPEWYTESPVIVTYPVRGKHDMDIMEPNALYPYINAMKYVDDLAEKTNSRIMVLLMHWEGTAPWAPPYVWPPFGGTEKLEEFIGALHDKGHLLGVYCSGLGWTQQSNVIKEYNRESDFNEKNLRDVMCLSPEGDLPYSNICTGQRSGYDLCPSQEFTVETLKSELKNMIHSGIDYVQILDQNHGGTSYFCYSRYHGHPPVPGKWQVHAMKNLLNELNKIANNKKVLLGCESAAAETYIPNLLFSDNRYNLNYNLGRPVPVYSYIYHKYINNFMGNQVATEGIFNHKTSPDNLLYRIAYAFAAGDMMTLVINDSGQICWNWGTRDTDTMPNQENVIELIKNINLWRKDIGKKYLQFGEMVKPFNVITEGENTFDRIHGSKIVDNKIICSCWKADDNSIGQFIINYNAYDINCDIEFDEDKDSRLYVEGKPAGEFNGKKIAVSIKALSAVMIVTN